MREEEIKQTQLEEVLGRFGLNKHETAVYLAMLVVGARPAGIIAEQANLKRAHTYKILASLMEMGIVQEFEKRGVRHFSCSPPANLVTLLKEKELKIRESREMLVQALPALEKLHNPHHSPPKVRFYSGFAGIREVFEESLKAEPDVIYGMTDPEQTFHRHGGKLDSVLRDYVEQRVKLGIWFHSIQPYAKETLAEVTRPGYTATRKRKVKMLPGLNVNTEIHVYHDRVAMISTADNLMAVLIEDIGIAESITSLFKTIWEMLPEII